MSETTVRRGVFEVESGEKPLGRVRSPGGGRKRVADLLALVEPDVRGDPMSPPRWTVKSTRTLARELTRAGHRVSADTVAGRIREGCSLQAPLARRRLNVLWALLRDGRPFETSPPPRAASLG